MMDYTDRHCRYFLRLLSPGALLYTEMITAAALVRGRATRLLEFDAAEHPVALQLGGSDPAELAEAAKLGAGVWIRRDQSQLRLSERSRAERPLRGMPHGRACTGGGMRSRDAAGCGDSGDREMPHRDRPDAGRRERRRVLVPLAFRQDDRRRRLLGVRRACAARSAERTEPEGEPGDSAAQVRSRAATARRVPITHVRRQRRRAHGRGRAPAPEGLRRRHDRPRGVSESVSAG